MILCDIGNSTAKFYNNGISKENYKTGKRSRKTCYHSHTNDA